MGRKMNEIKEIRRYSEAFKLKVVEEVEGGYMSKSEACREYGIKSPKSIHGWLKKYGTKKYTTKILEVSMKSESERIRELEKALSDEHVKRVLYEAQLEDYAKRVPDLKKRLSTKALQRFEENESKIANLK